MVNKIKLFEMFSGYGGASFALKKAGILFECVGFSEIDKYAIQCYEQNHGERSSQSGITNYGDATKIQADLLPDFDLLTGGFPCQAFSVAGKGLGELDTRGTLFNEIIRIAEAKKPKYMLLENVKGLTTKKHKATFDKILSEFKRIGYNVTWNILNTKDYGIPQNRERVFFVCFRKDITDGGLIDDFKANSSFLLFDFPEKEELKLFLKDILEPVVEDKYFLSDKTVATLTRHHNKIIGKTENPPYSACIHANYFKMGGRDQQYCLHIKNATKKGYLEGYPGDGVSLEFPDSKTRRGRVQTQLSPTLQCNDAKGVITKDLAIRKFTPKECFRLMGFLDDKINLTGLSDTQRYKLAGNGWDINLVSKIFKEMFR